MAAEAIMNACADAGISHKQIDGFAYYSTAGAGYLDKFDTASLMETLGMPHISFSATLTSGGGGCVGAVGLATAKSEEHTSELQSLMRISYAVFCLKKKNNNKT